MTVGRDCWDTNAIMSKPACNHTLPRYIKISRWTRGHYVVKKYRQRQIWHTVRGRMLNIQCKEAGGVEVREKLSMAG